MQIINNCLLFLDPRVRTSKLAYRQPQKCASVLDRSPTLAEGGVLHLILQIHSVSLEVTLPSDFSVELVTNSISKLYRAEIYPWDVYTTFSVQIPQPTIVPSGKLR